MIYIIILLATTQVAVIALLIRADLRVRKSIKNGSPTYPKDLIVFKFTRRGLDHPDDL